MIIDLFASNLLNIMTYDCYKMTPNELGTCESDFGEPSLELPESLGTVGMGFLVDEYKIHFQKIHMHGIPYFMGCLFGLFYFNFKQAEINRNYKHSSQFIQSQDQEAYQDNDINQVQKQSELDIIQPSYTFKISKWKNVIGWISCVGGVILCVACFPALMITAVIWSFGRHVIWSLALSWICFVGLMKKPENFRRKSSSSADDVIGQENPACDEKFSEVDLSENAGEITGDTSPEIHQVTIPEPLMVRFLRFFYQNSSISWSKIYLWSLLLLPIIVQNYYHIYLEDALYMQSSTLLILWFGFSMFNYVISYVLKICLF